MDITKAIEIIKTYGLSMGRTDMLATLNDMLCDADITDRERAALNLFMYEGRKMFESVKIKVGVSV